GAQIDRTPPEPDRLTRAEPGVKERVDQRVALRVLPSEILAQHVALGLGERVGPVGWPPLPLHVGEGITGDEASLARVAVERAKRAVDDVAGGFQGESLAHAHQAA